MGMLQGSLVALATPMASDGALDLAGLDQLVEYHIDNGTDAIVAVGTTGESATLDYGEHCAVIRRVVDAVSGRVPVIAGTGANATSEAIELTRCALQAHADACLLVTPYYNKPTQEGLYRHFRTVAETVPIPQILYNVPGRTACDMVPDTVVRLAGIDNIIGIKEATGTVSRIAELLEKTDNGFSVFSGDDAIALDAILAGAKGVISVTANVAPQAMHEMCALALAGDVDAARAANRRLTALHDALFVESNPIPVKWALHEMGLIPPGIRLPLTPLSPEGQDKVRLALSQAGVL